jgi:hypothetical protein
MNPPHPATLAAWSCLMLSALLVFVAPAWMPDSYSAFRHSISESAAQGWARAVPVRLGLALLGVGAALASLHMAPAFTAWSTRVFALAMLLSAVWSHRSWLADLPFDAAADQAHSWAAQAAGMAMVAALLGRMTQRWATARQIDALEAATLLACAGVPLLWLSGFGWHGAAQRGMFLLAYAWLAREASR